MQKKGMFQIFLRTFLKTIGIIVMFLAIGVGSYFLTMLFHKTTERVERSTKYEHVIEVNPSSESSNLIYSVDSDTKEVKAVVLELFDKETGNLDYVTIPNKTQISLSSQDYTKYLEVSQLLPQIVTLKDLNEYFSGDVAYEYGILFLQSELDVEIGYFTALDKVEFNKRFVKKNNAFVPRTEYLDTVAENKDEKAMEDFIEKEWDVVISDITLSQKQQYAEGFLKVNRDFIYAHRAYAEEIKGQAVLDAKKTTQMIKKIWENGPRTEKQSGVGGSGNTSQLKKIRNRTIQITNGSRIDGLAASFQTKLTADGLTVLGVGDFGGEIQQRTVIYAKKKKWAKCLKDYFNNPRIEQAPALTNGADIEIVLGLDDGPSATATP
nr:LytR C-terminal domain-containing protein [Eubacterium sp.]